MANGNTLLGSIQGVFHEVDPAGNEVSKTPTRGDTIDIRLMRFSPRGTLLLGAAKPKAVVEVGRNGEILRVLPLPGKGYKAIELPNGHILSGTGDQVKILELDAAGKQLSFVGGKAAHPTLQLDFCSGWDLLPNGNRVMANWQGHGDFPTAPHLVEFTPDNNVVWTWGDHEKAKQVTNVLFLDEGAAAGTRE
jgi:hypothetical protein